MGESALIDGWEVTIVSVEPSGSVERYESESPDDLGFLVTVEGTYRGEDEGQLANFTLKYVGADFVVYSDHDSRSDDETDPNRVVAGGKATWVTSIAFPAEAAGNSVLSIEGFGFDDSEAQWDVGAPLS